VQIRTNAVYAIRACRVLANQTSPTSPMSLAELGEAVGLSPGSMQQALIPVLREGIVSSRRGSRGGYLLRKKAVSIGAIVAAFGDGICAEVAGDSEEEARIRRKIGSCVERALRRMKLDDI
jgi:DNA-binding IscR family transcriptional regulator